MACTTTLYLPRTPEDTRDTAEYKQLLRIYEALFALKAGFDCIESEVAALTPVVATAVQSASNLGTGAQLFKAKVGTDLTFRSLKQGSGITVTQNATEVQLDVPAAPAPAIQITSGNTQVDFGAFPGKAEARVTVSGQGTILTTAKADAWVRSELTSAHSAEEHSIEDFDVYAETIVAANGFTIVVRPRVGRSYGLYNVNWSWTP